MLKSDHHKKLAAEFLDLWEDHLRACAADKPKSHTIDQDTSSLDDKGKADGNK